jgi:hypothetical protein
VTSVEKIRPPLQRRNRTEFSPASLLCFMAPEMMQNKNNNLKEDKKILIQPK